METDTKVCKFYVKNGKCKHDNDCKYAHIDNVCVYFFLTGKCRNGDQCQRSHEYQVTHTTQTHTEDKNKNKKKNVHKKKNTECFTPSFDSADMTVKFSCAMESGVYPYKYEPRDVILVSDLFVDMKGIAYEKLLDEIKDTGKEDKIWKLWHGDTHYIADDGMHYKEKCPTFMKVIDRLREYFNIDVKATRLNWYSDPNEWKPYHFDAAAVDPEKAKVQNFTIGVSFGDTREASFQHAQTKTTVNFPMNNGMVYGFGSQTNMEWRHGIPPIHPDQYEQGRISIIVWGWVDMK